LGVASHSQPIIRHTPIPQPSQRSAQLTANNSAHLCQPGGHAVSLTSIVSGAFKGAFVQVVPQRAVQVQRLRGADGWAGGGLSEQGASTP
jgi:hypothetical protein